MKRLCLKTVNGLLLVICGWVVAGIGLGCASQASKANRYSSVSTKAIQTGKPIEVPEKTPYLKKPDPVVK